MTRKGKILLWASNIWNFADGMFGPLFAVFTEQIGGNILDISWAWSIYLMVTGCCVIFVGKISDHVPKEKLLITGYMLNALFTFGYLFVTTPAQLFFLQGMLGVSFSLLNPTWYALYDEYTLKRSDGYAWGLADGEGRILMGLAIVVGGFLVNKLGFQVLFFSMGLLQLLATAYLWKFLRLKKSR